MDKQNFVTYLKGLNIKPEVEKIVLDYVDNHEYNDEMVDKVVKILEAAGDLSQSASEALNNTADAVEDLKEVLQDRIENDKEVSDEESAKLADDLVKMLEEVGGKDPHNLSSQIATPMVPATPVQEVAHLDNFSPAPQADDTQNAQPVAADTGTSQNTAPTF